MAVRPTFRIKKNGYDRFAVDDAIDAYARQVEDLQKQIEDYKVQLNESRQKLQQLQNQMRDMERNAGVQQSAADHIARLSLQEANQIIATAQHNADAIISEALSTSRSILMDLESICADAGTTKSQATEQLRHLLAELDDFQPPSLPDISWLKEAEKKMR